MTISRRDFVCSGAAFAAAGVGGGAVMGRQERPAPAAAARGPGGPIIISSGNGLRTCDKANELIGQGVHPLDAVVQGINIVELDPSDRSVGYGGLPNEDGVVQLDACVMDGPLHRSGAVACLENIKTPSSVALLVARRTDHCLLVGAGALKFAKAHGFKEEDLLTEESRQAWLKWKETISDKDNWFPPEDGKGSTRGQAGDDREFTTGTITCIALTKAGDLYGCTSTSGLSWKLAGRVGDSPIVGAGLYIDNDLGGCGSTGRGEANIMNLSCFHIVEQMGRGMTPEEACVEQLRRVAAKTEKRLRNPKGEPAYGLTFYAVRKDGLYGGATMRSEAKMSVHDGQPARHVPIKGLYQD